MIILKDYLPHTEIGYYQERLTQEIGKTASGKEKVKEFTLRVEVQALQILDIYINTLLHSKEHSKSGLEQKVVKAFEKATNELDREKLIQLANKMPEWFLKLGIPCKKCPYAPSKQTRIQLADTLAVNYTFLVECRINKWHKAATESEKQLIMKLAPKIQRKVIRSVAREFRSWSREDLVSHLEFITSDSGKSGIELAIKLHQMMQTQYETTKKEFLADFKKSTTSPRLSQSTLPEKSIQELIKNHFC